MADTVKVALLGLGTIGSGVYKLIERQQEEMSSKAGASIEIAAILVHNLGKEREGVDRTLLTDRWEDIINNEEIQIVIELMGGIEPARTMILEALKAGKNVVTANKDLVAEYGGELLDTAAEKGVDFLFEAAVGGGIPIIRPMKQCLAVNEIDEVMGIVNGTTNYILTKMFEEGWILTRLLPRRRSLAMRRQTLRRMWRDWMQGARSPSLLPSPFIPGSVSRTYIQKGSPGSQPGILPMPGNWAV